MAIEFPKNVPIEDTINNNKGLQHLTFLLEKYIQAVIIPATRKFINNI